MNTIINNNKLQSPVAKVNKRLNAYEQTVLFPKKVRQANEMLKNVGLPKFK
ncbi:MAG: hypothetical protein LBS94_01890 [Prevotellaceae bacterium]|jgi:hypothetical protein|nr:hypothetical protein [Prevotellaceae bacterium]